MATIFERLAILITGEAISAVNAFKEVGTAAEVAGEKVTLSQKATGALGSSFGSLATGALAAGGIAAGALAVEKLANSFADATGQVRAFQRVSGASAEEASHLVAAANVLGVDTDKLGLSMFRLSKNLDGNAETLKKYGVAVAKGKDGSVDLTGTLLNVADAASKTDDAQKRNALAAAAFGRGASALLPILLRGRDGLKEFFDAADKQGLTFDQSQLDKGRDFSIATKKAEDAVKGLAVQLGEGLVPALTSASDGLTTFIEKANELTKPVGGIGGAVEGVVKAGQGFAPIQSILDALHGDFGKIAGDLPVLGTGIDLVHGHFRAALGSIIPLLGEHKHKTDDAATATDKAAAAAKAAADAIANEDAALKAAQAAIDAYIKAWDASARAQRSAETAHRATITAQRAEGNAQDDLNVLMAHGAVDADAVAQAEKGVASASRATADAQKAEAKSAQAVADARSNVLDAEVALEKVKQGASAEDVQKAALAANKAKRDQERAILGLADAQDKANSLVVTGIIGVGQQAATTRDLLTANLDLADAQDEIQTSAFNAKDAQDALTKVQQQGKDGSDDLKAAQEDLKKKQDALNQAVQDQADAQQNVIDKQADEIDAADKLKKALEGDPDFNKKIADAQQKVADAHQNTVDQIRDEKDAVEALNKSEGELIKARAERGAAVPTIPSDVSGPSVNRTTTSSAFGSGVLVTGNVHLQVSGSQLATITQDQLAAAARRSGLN